MAVKKTKKITKRIVSQKQPQIKTKKISGLHIAHFDLKGGSKPLISVPKEISEAKINLPLVAQAVRVQLGNLRQGTVSTKTRSEVTGSTRKIYRQKGTGRARHGSIKAPIFVGGGIVFGPKPRNFNSKLSKKMRKLALREILNDKIHSQAVSIVSGFSEISGKTREINELLKTLNLSQKQVLFIFSTKMEKAIKAARNIPNVSIRPANSLSVLEIAGNEHLILANEAWTDICKNIFKVN